MPRSEGDYEAVSVGTVVLVGVGVGCGVGVYAGLAVGESSSVTQ